MRPPAVSAVARCAEPLTDGRRYVTVHLLTGQRLYFSVDPKSRLTELFTGVAEQMCLQGMQDPDLFGLAVMLDGEYVFVDPENKIGKYAPKAWKASQTNGLDNSKEPLLQFSFRVKFYVECHLLLRDPVSRHHYYLQLRENVLVHRQSACSQEGWLLLAGWALQADMGNCPESASGPYFQPTDYFPKWLIARLGVDAILSAMPSVHRENTDMPRGEAEMAYIREASSMEAPHNLHIYRLKRRKSDQTGTVLLGICPNGIELYQEEKNNVRKLMASFVWTNISKLSFEKKRFEISALTQKFTFYTNNDEKSKHLFHLCKQIHLFTQSVKERLAALRQRTEDERRSLAGSLQYASGLHSGWEYLHKDGKSIDQRVSVISNTSSNTTSGIVSDRTVQSLDESDDDMRLETLINSGPAESVESGMDSLTRSLSQLDAASLRSSQKSPADDSSSTLAVPPPGPRSEPAATSTGGSPGVEGSPATGTAPPDVSRAGSAHSSSSQHSSSTVRSRYSLTKLTAHQTVDIDDEGDETPGRGRLPPFSASSANCCSTCVEDDAASECSEARDRARQCACGAAADGASLASGSTLYTLQGGSPRSRRAASGSESLSRSHRSQSSVASVASTADSTRAVDSDAQGDSSVYDYASASSSAAAPEYVDFYRPAAAEAAARGAPSGDSASVRSGASLASAASSGGAATLDYSVHSAHTSVGSVITTPGTFPGKTTVSDTLDTDSDYVQVPYDRLGQFRLSEAPMGGVAMETVTTVTPVCVAQSCQTTDAEETPQAPPPAAQRGVSSQATSTPVQVVPRGMSSVAPPSSSPPSSQAPARLVTTLPMVTVFTAHVYPAVTQSARFAAAPARLRVSAAPARPKPMVARSEAQALMRSTSHEAGLVIGGNNYLDVRASHPALSPALRPLEQATAPPRTSGLATVYINQVTRSQIEQFERQLLSDSDYVIYPHKDPAISRQEYVDAKHCSLVAGGPPAGLPPPPPYRAPHTAAHYRSSPNVAGPYAATTLVPPPPGPYAVSAGLAHYGSVQALSDRLDGLRHARHHLSSHSLASSAAGSDAMSAPTPADAELLRAALLAGGRRSSGVLRAKSDENLLSAGASERRPERPPPPYWQTQPRLQGVPSPSLNQLNQPSVVQQHQLQQQQKLQQLQQQQLRQQQQQLQQEQLRQQQQQQLQQEQLKQQQQQLIQQQLFQQQLLQQKQQAQQNQQLLKQQQQQQQQLQQQKQLEEHAQQTQQQQHRQTLEKHQLLVRQQQQQQRQQQQQTEQQLEEQVQQQKQQQQRQTLEKHQLLIRQHLERIQQLSPAPSGGGSSGVGGSTTLQSTQSHNRLPSAASDDLDIDGLRAASHQMDLPLIQALCHDRLLRRPPNGRPKTWHEAQVTSSSSSPAPSQAPTPGPGPRPLPAHPAAGQPLLAKHKSLGLPAFPEQRRAPVTSAAGAQLMAALERRAPATSHRHPQPQPQQSQQQLKTVAKRDPRTAPVR